MKRNIVLLVFVLVALVIVAISFVTVSEAGEPNPFDGRFVECKASSASTVIVDKTTGVCYLYRHVGYGAGITVLLDTDGTPLTYEEAWFQMFEENDNYE